MSGTDEPQPQVRSSPDTTVMDSVPNIGRVATEVLVIAADRSLRSALRRLQEVPAPWVVVVRSHESGTFYYAYRRHELDQLETTHRQLLDGLLQDALELHEWSSSARARGGRPIGAPHPGRDSPATGRIVDFDAAGQIVAVGEYRDRLVEWTEVAEPGAPNDTVRNDLAVPAAHQDRESPLETFDLGPMRGGYHGNIASAEPAEPREVIDGAAPARIDLVEPAEIEVVISAETKSEIEIGRSQRIDFRIEFSEDALPLAASAAATARSDVPIIILLSVENEALGIVGSGEMKVFPPASGQPSVGNFIVKGLKAGVVRLAVTFRQGGSELGVIGLAVEVVANGAKERSAQGRATATPADPADDDKLAVMIEQRAENGRVFYRYTLHSEALNIQYEAFDSKPLLDRGGGAATIAQAFVERIYTRVTQELKSYDDLKALQREARALGAGLSRELFEPDVARRLWPLRDRVKLIQIRSWEPYIPWELVRLHNPDTDETDDRFLAEYSLVRTLTDREPVRQLPMKKWSYLAATYPMGSFAPVGAELNYFTSTTTPSLLARSIAPDPIAATKDAFYDALAEGQFDVLHISCHAESAHQSIEDASLIIGDATAPGASKPHLIQVNAETVRNEAKLMGRRPLVFLNACETARVGAVLTAWGGWPNVFVRAGAGAFVGAAWAVRDKPAAAFATAFYEALWNEKTLAEAAGAARQAAKKFGDASWLAFKVYGHPRARRTA